MPYRAFAAGMNDLPGGVHLTMLSATSDLRKTLVRMKSAIIVVAVLSALLNILLLGGSIYMMLIYDTVLPSHSIPTLFGLLIMVVIVFAFQGLFDILRSRMVADIGASFHNRMINRIQNVMFETILRKSVPSSRATAPVRDLDTIRSFMASPGPSAFMDLPWIFFFLIVLAFLHYWLAVTAFVGALVMIALTYLMHRIAAGPTEAVFQASGVRNLLTDETRRHAELIHVMGMRRRLQNRWNNVNSNQLAAQQQLTRATTGLSGGSRVFRMFLQSLVLTIGALLVIDGQATGGVIFASSIIAARALAPIDQAIANWKGFASARESWHRLETLLEKVPVPTESATVLPPPEQSIQAEGLVIVPPGSQNIVAQGVSFQLNAGDALGVIGMSGSGKSSLVRAVIGAWRPARGKVRLDGATLDQYDDEQLGGYIGYLPQTVELLAGSVAENIARFVETQDSGAVISAAKAAGVHDLIVNLPMGYETQVGSDGDELSAGQRQRVGLARALYGEPFLVVLDEPNSNLDAQGEAALDAAIQSVRDRGGIVIVVAHRSAAIARTNFLLYMHEGRMEAFGPKEQVMAMLTKKRITEQSGEEKAKSHSLSEG